MGYELEINKLVYSENGEAICNSICVKKDNVGVILMDFIRNPAIRLRPESNVIIRIYPKWDIKEQMSFNFEGELRDSQELGVMIFLEDRKVEFYRKGVGFFRVNEKGALLFQGYKNNAKELFFEKITKHCINIPADSIPIISRIGLESLKDTQRQDNEQQNNCDC